MTLVFERIQNNCPLPCWWGLIPGTSTGLDAYNTFSPLIGISYNHYLSPTDGGTINFRFEVDDLQTYLRLHYKLLSNSTRIEVIRIGTDGIYFSDFKQYTLQSILSTYGLPSQVGLAADIYQFEPNAPTFFYIYLSYSEKGFYLRYTTPVDNLSSEKILSCPSKATVEMWLMTPDNNDSNQQILTTMDMDWGYPHKPLIEAAQMSIEQFYQLFSNSASQCLSTSKSIWLP